MLRLEKVNAQVLKWINVKLNGIMNHNPNVMANAEKKEEKLTQLILW